MKGSLMKVTRLVLVLCLVIGVCLFASQALAPQEKQEEVGNKALLRIEICKDGSIKVYDMQGNLIDTTSVNAQENKELLPEAASPSLNIENAKNTSDVTPVENKSTSLETGASSSSIENLKKSQLIKLQPETLLEPPTTDITSPNATPNLSYYTGEGSDNSYTYNTSTHVLTVNSSIGNYGSSQAGSFRVGYYVSINTTINTNDYLVSSATQSYLLSGYYVNLSGTGDLDNVNSLPDGTYYVGFYIDDQFEVSESDENDNTAYFSEPIDYSSGGTAPNLSVYTGGGSDNSYTYNTNTHVLTVNSSVGNYGSSQAGSFRVGYYVSTNTTINTNDYLVSSATQSYLMSGYYANLSGTGDLDDVSSLPDGTYYVGFYIDDQFAVSESDENDNTAYFTTTIDYSSGGGEPDIDVNPLTLEIHKNGSGSAIGGVNIAPSKKSEHAMGLIIPEHVKEYWKTHTPKLQYNKDLLASSIDWSVNDSPVKDQGICGSCWAFSTIGLVENLGGLSDLSEQTLVSCIPDNDCDGGWHGYALEYIHNDGAPDEACFPYIAQNGNCADKCSEPAVLVKIQQYDKYGRWGEPTSSTVNDLKALLQSGPALVSMDVPDDNTFNGTPGYTGGIYNYNGGAIPSGQGHSVLLVGYNDAQQYFKAKNSWGSNWGENGYFRIAYDDVTDDVHFGGYACTGSGIVIEGGEENTFTISNTGNATLTINSITDNRNWMSTSGHPGTPFNITAGNSQTVTVDVDWALVGGTTQTGTITINSNDPDEQTVTIQVTVIPGQGVPVLSVTPVNRDVSATSGTTTFSVSNTGSGTMSYTASVTQGSDWLSITSGGSGVNSGTITAGYDANSTTSQRVGIISVTAPGATGSPKSVTVTQQARSIEQITWQTNLTVTDAGNESGTLTFGQGPNATDGLDPAYGEVELPPPSPTGVFDVRFELPVSPTIGSLKDYRNDTKESINWRIKFQPGSSGYPMNFTWNNADLPEGRFSLKDEIVGTLVNVNMKTQNSYSLTNQGITSLKIEYTNQGGQDVSVVSGWNIISVPLAAPDMSVSALFPDATSSAYGFDNRYVTATTLNNGKGYWLKFDSDHTYSISGSIVSPKEIPVNAGWNIIGPFETEVAVSAITTTPGEISSDFFGYNKRYIIATILKPGNGYWVKVSQAGTIIIPSSYMSAMKTIESVPTYVANTNSSWPKIIIEDSDGNIGTLFIAFEETVADFELPPIPPAGIFDVRFSNDRYVEEIDNINNQIQINSAKYPIRIKVQNLDDRILKVKDLLGGDVLDETLVADKEIVISTALDKITLESHNLPTQFELSQNYPNPFNPTTEITFLIPEDSNVKLTIYDALGKRVSELVDQKYSAGYHKVVFNAQNIPSGLYFYMMEAANFKEIKKMIVLK